MISLTALFAKLNNVSKPKPSPERLKLQELTVDMLKMVYGQTTLPINFTDTELTEQLRKTIIAFVHMLSETKQRKYKNVHKMPVFGLIKTLYKLRGV